MSKLTLQQVLAAYRTRYSTDQQMWRSARAQAAAWYKQGYYMREDGQWYGAHGGVEYRKYYTGA